MAQRLFLILTAAGLLPALPSPHAAEPTAGKPVYRWVTPNGEVHYGDRVPTEYLDLERSVLNRQGLVVKTIEAAKSQQQLDEAERLGRLADQDTQRRKESAAYDNMLLNTFASEAELLAARDNKLAILEDAIRATGTRTAEQKAYLLGLLNEAIRLRNEGQPMSLKLRSDIDLYRRQIAINDGYITSRRDEQAQLKKRFTVDLVRYRTLKSGRLQPIRPSR